MPKELTDREARIRAYALSYLMRRGHLSNRSYDEAMEHGRAVMRLADRRVMHAVPDNDSDPNQPEAA